MKITRPDLGGCASPLKISFKIVLNLHIWKWQPINKEISNKNEACSQNCEK
jgi:hypothetical protein